MVIIVLNFGRWTAANGFLTRSRHDRSGESISVGPWVLRRKGLEIGSLDGYRPTNLLEN
jgi:hypothetical protein